MHPLALHPAAQLCVALMPCLGEEEGAGSRFRAISSPASQFKYLRLLGSEYLLLLSFLCAQLVIFTLQVLITAFSPCCGEQLCPAVMWLGWIVVGVQRD